MSPDVIDRLHALRPAPTLSAAERTTMLAAILDADLKTPHRPAVVLATRTPRRRRVLLSAAIVGLAGAATVLIPVLASPAGPGAPTSAAAAELHRLSVVTGQGRSVDLGPGDYWYVDQTEVQTGSARDLFGDTGPDHTVTLTTRHRSWTDQDGNIWRQDSGTDDNGKDVVTTWYFAHGSAGLAPDYLAALPTDPGRLHEYLRAHASGSNSTDEAVFVAVAPILQSGVASPQLRAAAVQVLAATDHVTVTRDVHDSTGRPAERITFDDESVRAGVQSIFFDTETARVLETSTTSPGASLSNTTHAAELTHSVPDAVKAAAQHGN